MKLHVEVLASRALRFGDGSPVRAASGVAHFGDGWLVVQDDATHGAWCRPGGIEPIRIVEAVQGHDHFSSAAGTKHLKPDFEAAVDLDDQDRGQVVVFGSGSTGARMQAALVTLHQGSWRTTVADLSELYGAVARELGVALAELNLEGACIVGSRLRWFNRGNLRGGVPSASVDLDLAALLSLFAGTADLDRVVGSLGGHRQYELGSIDGVGLAITDAVTLADGRVLVSAAAEDTPNAYDDGPVVGAALALIDDASVVAETAIPLLEGRVQKVEGLTVVDGGTHRARLIAVVDDDDPELASTEHHLDVSWG